MDCEWKNLLTIKNRDDEENELIKGILSVSRVNRLARTLVVSRDLFRREAIDQDIASQAMSKFDYKIPFMNIFGKNIYRTVIPLRSPMQKEVEQAVEELTDPQGVKKFDGIDWVKGEAYKVVPPHEKAPPGTPSKVQYTNLGKALGRLPGSKKYLNWWSQSQGERDPNGYSIIISRHPLDVIRMSDFKGDEEEDYPDIRSCHSPGSGEWDSCVNEMKHGGPIAYLVKNKDLWSLNPKQVAGRNEIFADPDRNVPGIRPLSRLRLRRFTHETDGFDLAIPETKVYGNPSSDFKEQVQDWARITQAETTGGHRWRMNEFMRRGGDYSDSDDSTLFNRFFEDHLDRGNTTGVPGKGQEAENERRRNEIRQIHDAWRNRFIYCSVDYDGEEDDDEVVFFWSGNMRVYIPQNQFGSEISELYMGSGAGSLREALSDKDFYFREINVDPVRNHIYGDYVNFIFNIECNLCAGDPDGYDTFCNEVFRDYDSKYDQIKKVTTNWLYENEHIPPSPVRKFMVDIENEIHQFKNFKVNWDKGDLVAYAEANIGQSNSFSTYMTSSVKEFSETVEVEVRKLVENEIKKIIASQKSTGGYSPGFEPAPSKRETYNPYLFNVKVSINYPNFIMMEIQFAATDLTTQEEMSEMIDMLKIVDQMFPQIVKECEIWLHRHEQQLLKYNQEYREHVSKFKTGKDFRDFKFDPRQAKRHRRRTVQEIFAP
jgi:hypothetical protein